MKKKRWIILVIVLVVLCLGTTCFLYIKQHGEHKTVSECQDFIDECYKKNFEFWAGGGHMYQIYPDGSTSLDYKANCPEDCSRYTEKRGYFKDKEKQQEYYDNKVKECEKEYKKCIEKAGRSIPFDCHTCDKYGQPMYQWN